MVNKRESVSPGDSLCNGGKKILFFLFRPNNCFKCGYNKAVELYVAPCNALHANLIFMLRVTSTLSELALYESPNEKLLRES